MRAYIPNHAGMLHKHTLCANTIKPTTKPSVHARFCSHLSDLLSMHPSFLPASANFLRQWPMAQPAPTPRSAVLKSRCATHIHPGLSIVMCCCVISSLSPASPSLHSACQPGPRRSKATCPVRSTAHCSCRVNSQPCTHFLLRTCARAHLQRRCLPYTPPHSYQQNKKEGQPA